MEIPLAAGAASSAPAEALALRALLDKNFWLVRIRWIYPLFVISFFMAHRFLSQTSLIGSGEALLIFLLPYFANVLFWLIIRRRQRETAAAPNESRFDLWQALISGQLRFDLALLALTAFFSGGLDSPVIALMLVYALAASFLVDIRKALGHTLWAMALILAIALLQGGAAILAGPQVTILLAYYFLFVFAYFVAGYLARKLQHDQELMRELLQQTRELSIRDGLTGLYNQMHFFELLQRESERAGRGERCFSLIIFDVDHFKNYNDCHGHVRGSATLREIAAIMKAKFRASDLLAKYGGDEFVIILPASDKVGAFLAAERLREAVERHPFAGGETQPHQRITISVGLASCPEHGRSAEEVLNRADRSLYAAKEAGRNRTVIYHESVESENE